MSEQKYYDVDYLSVKRRLKSFLSEQTAFKDYNFEGSAISMWMHFIAFIVVYINSVLNFFSNEMFIDSARLEDNVLKHAYQKNYLPRRRVASHIVVSIKNNHTSTITIPIGTTFQMGLVKLTNIEEIVITASSTSEVTLYQGEYITVTHSFEGKDFETIRLVDRSEVAQNYFFVSVNGVVWNSVFDDMNFRGANVYFIRYLRNFDIRFDEANGLFNVPNLGDNIQVKYIKTDGAALNGTTFASSITMPTFAQANLLSVLTSDVLKDGYDEESLDSIALKAPINQATAGRVVNERDYNYKINQAPLSENFYELVAYSSHRDFINQDHEQVPLLDSDTVRKDVGFYVYSGIKRTVDDFIATYNFRMTTAEHSSIIDYLGHYRHMQTFPKFKVTNVLRLKPLLSIKLLGGFDVNKLEFENEIYQHIEDNYVGYNKSINKSEMTRFLKQYDFVDYVDINYSCDVVIDAALNQMKVDDVSGFKVGMYVQDGATVGAGFIVEIWEAKKILVIRRTSFYNFQAGTISSSSGSAPTANIIANYQNAVVRLFTSIAQSSIGGNFVYDDAGNIKRKSNGAIIGSVNYDVGFIEFSDIFPHPTPDIIPRVTFSVTINDTINISTQRELFLDHQRAEVTYLT